MAQEFSDLVSVFESGVRLAVKAKPGASRARPPRIVALAGNTRVLEIAVAAKAEGGKANMAVLEALATEIGLRKADLDIKAGARGRLKVIEIRGDAESLRARITAWMKGLSAED